MMVEMNKILMICLVALPMASCSLIDDDMDECGQEYGADYDLKLVTNLTTELNTELSTEVESHVAEALNTELKDIFREHAHDIDLSFYNDNDERELHEQHIMDASQASYNLYLPVKDYTHLALANIADASETLYVDDSHSKTAKLDLVEGDTIECLKTGIFTARKKISLIGGVDQSFDVHLYMANCAAIFVLDLNGHETKAMRVYATGFANEFMMNDSVYHYDHAHYIKAKELQLDGETHRCFYTVNYPSRDSKTTTKADDNTGLWQVYVYVTQPDGTTTQNILNIDEPLKAGQLKIIKAKLYDNGELQSETKNVGVSVTLDWKEGGTYEPTL